jgi:hypothetical protein
MQMSINFSSKLNNQSTGTKVAVNRTLIFKVEKVLVGMEANTVVSKEFISRISLRQKTNNEA